MASLLRRPQSTFSPLSEPQTTYSINHSFIVPLGIITYTKVTIFWQSPQGLWQYVQYTSNQTGRKSTLHELTVIFNWLDSKDPVILDSDLNCQKDKTNKSREVTDFLEEGLKVINCLAMVTYICRNGCGTIDLVFCNSRLKLLNRKVLWTSGTTPIRKQVLIATSIKLESKHITESPENLRTGCHRRSQR
jgi:hypothetical protein